MLRQKLSILEGLRARSEPLPRGIAPYTSSHLFKIQEPGSKPKANLWDHRFSLRGLDQHASSLKAAARTLSPSSIISLGTARPLPEFFPWESVLMHVAHDNSDKGDMPVGWTACTKGEDAYDLSVALNYGYAAGSPQVLRFITEHVELIHSPPYDDWESCLTSGTTSAIDMVLRIFCHPGDWILVESHTYSGTIDAAKAQGLNMLGVKMDGLGLLPDDLDLSLRTWDVTQGPKPFVLYMIPSGQNPTGTTQSTERRKAIYQVAEQHDLYIVEDDPYYYLQLGENTDGSPAGESTQISAEEFLKRLPVSYLSLDVSGRVLRLDTTSKIIAPGLRCGWMTGCSQVIQKFLALTELSTVSPSGPSQVMLYKLLDETWGHQGFIAWLTHLSSQYRQRRNTLIKACKRYLPSDICHWTVPTAGMVLWIGINVSKHTEVRPTCSPQQVQESHLDIEDRIYVAAKENGVLVSKGSWFAANNEQQCDVFFRFTFAAAPEVALAQAVKIFGNALRTEFMLNQ